MAKKPVEPAAEQPPEMTLAQAREVVSQIVNQHRALHMLEAALIASSQIEAVMTSGEAKAKELNDSLAELQTRKGQLTAEVAQQAEFFKAEGVRLDKERGDKIDAMTRELEAEAVTINAKKSEMNVALTELQKQNDQKILQSNTRRDQANDQAAAAEKNLGAIRDRLLAVSPPPAPADAG